MSVGAQHAASDVLIIGGGIAGLAAALRLRSLDRSCRVAIIDASPRLGGKIAGETVDGCVVDGGPDVCIGEKLRATHLFSDLDLESRAIRVNPAALPTHERRGATLSQAPTTFTGELVTFPGGMHELVDAVRAALNDVLVIHGAPVTSLTRENGHWIARTDTGAAYSATSAIVATPAEASAAILASVAPLESAVLRSLHYPATTTVTMAWRARDVSHALEGTGYLVTDPDAVLGACTWTSSKNPTHASAGTVLLRGYIRGVGTDALALLRAEVATVLGITAEPLFARVYEWPAGIPAYTAEHTAAVLELEKRLESARGVFIAGSAFHGVGVPDCIASGERAAAAAVSRRRQGIAEEAA